jgi:hypothetical protein
MSFIRERKLQVTDNGDDVLEVHTLPFDEDVDWTDDNEAILAAAVIGPDRYVGLNRADLRELRNFLNEVLTADAELQGEDEDF